MEKYQERPRVIAKKYWEGPRVIPKKDLEWLLRSTKEDCDRPRVIT